MSTDTTPAPIGADALRSKLFEIVTDVYDRSMQIDDAVIEIMDIVPSAAAQAQEAASLPAVQQCSGPTMDDAIAAGDGTLHGAIDHWMRRALDAERVLLSRGLVLEEAAKVCEEREQRFNRVDLRAACRLCAKDIRALAVVNDGLTTASTTHLEAPAAQGSA